MNKIVLDPMLTEKLQGGTQSAEVLDSSGRIVGHYLTHIEYLRLQMDADFAKPLDPAVREQAIRDWAEGRCKTTEEIRAGFARIRQGLEKQP